MRILVTAGTVYGPLDDNKLVGNRTRGIWATLFARWLLRRGHDVQLLVADVQREQINDHWERFFSENEDEDYARRSVRAAGAIGSIDILTHKGFWDYQEICYGLAHVNDAAVMAAAVVNWIPRQPFIGKISTTSLRELGREVGAQQFLTQYDPDNDEPIPGKTVVDIPFILAPRVIDGMRKENPNLTLIGCKLTIGADRDTMLDAAYKTLVGAKCHAVIANDMSALGTKTVLYPDRAAFDFDLKSTEDAGRNFYKHLEAIILDEHFTTVGVHPAEAFDGATPNVKLSTLVGVNVAGSYEECEDLFDKVTDKYRDRFVQKIAGKDLVFGSVAVRTGTGALCSPREKGALFSKRDAVDVLWPTDDDFNNRHVRVIHYGADLNGELPKATMNATLLLRQLKRWPGAAAILHLHEYLDEVPTVPYAPPGTVRDNLRALGSVLHVFNIAGHGFIAALDEHGEIILDRVPREVRP